MIPARIPLVVIAMQDETVRFVVDRIAPDEGQRTLALAENRARLRQIHRAY